MNVNKNHRDDAQKRQQLEDEMSRFEKEISGHTIDRPIIGTNTFRQAAQTIQDVHHTVPDNNPTNYGNFHQQHTHAMQGFTPNGMPVQNQMMPTQNMPMNNIGFHQRPMPNVLPMQHVPMQPQFPPTMTQGVPQMPMVPVGMSILPGNMNMTVPTEHITITPEEKKEWESAYGKKDNDAGGGKSKKKKFLRIAGGVLWEDQSLADWDPNDFRIFVGDLGNEVTDEALTRAFSKYPSFQKAKVIRERKTNKTKGYGFVSFKESTDFVKAMREMNGKYVGNRPIKLRKSTWKDRSIDVMKKKVKEKKKLGLR